MAKYNVVVEYEAGPDYPIVRIETKGDGWYRVMVNHRNGRGWTRHDRWGFTTEESATEYCTNNFYFIRNDIATVHHA